VVEISAGITAPMMVEHFDAVQNQLRLLTPRLVVLQDAK
jgi:hypothetical protein